MAMPTQFLIIMGFQLAGEALVSGCGLSFPGPLCGLLLLLAWLNYTGGPSAELSRAADILVDHLGLLFVPAGAAIVGFGALLLADSVAIVRSLLLSTGPCHPHHGPSQRCRGQSAGIAVSRMKVDECWQQ